MMGRTKVAILGGGMAALSTAYQLSQFPDRYDITVYQMGWRLGGKCAAGRNAAVGDRIEEHGLHVLFGWYENVFRLLRGCHATLGHADNAWQDAVIPGETLVAPELIDGVVVPWEVKLPHNEDSPGDGTDLLASPAQAIKNVLAWAASQMNQWDAPSGGRAAVPPDLDYVRGRILELQLQPRGDAEVATHVLEYPELAHMLVELSSEWETPDSRDQQSLAFLSDDFRKQISNDDFWYSLEPNDGARGIVDDIRTMLRRLRIFVDFGYTSAKGILVDLVTPNGTWFDLDDRDLREWLTYHHARKETVASSIVEAVYSSVFSTGTPGHPIAAGTMLQGALRAAFFFKGAALYHPNGALADVLFAPLYRALKARKVRFEFFHRVEELMLSTDKTRVEHVRLARQAVLAEGVGEYDPLVQVSGADAWPNAPKLELLADPDAVLGHDLENWWDPMAVEQVRLDVGRDFDVTVLAMSVAAIAEVFPDAMNDSQNDRFGWMVRGLATTQTQAMQMWFKPRLDQPTWPGTLPDRATIAVPYQMPFDTIADMRHILDHENPRVPVSSLYYLCGGLDDDEPMPPRGDVEYPARQLMRVRQNGASWLSTLGGALWDQAGPLVQLRDPHEEEWFQNQYFNAPVNPSDRYVLVRPGSSRYRLRAGDSGYANLALAGDWTLTAISVGCLEGATVGGIDAARAIDSEVAKAAGDWMPDGPMLPSSRVATSTPVHQRGQMIYRDGELLPQPPIKVPKLDVYTFLLAANEVDLQRLCDAQLNLGPEMLYRPLGPFVAFYASSMVNLVEPFGSADELDFGFWVPLIATSPDGNQRIVTYTPYAWVDSSWALVSGRSLFGYPKHMADLRFAPESGRFSLSTLALEKVGSSAEVLPLVEVSSDKCTPGSVLGDWAAFLEAGISVATKLLDAGRAPAICSLIMQTLKSPGMPMLFLKQLPGVGQDRAAVYQAVIEAPISVVPGPFALSPLRGSAQVVIHRYQSHSLVETLGLTVSKTEKGRSVLTPLVQGHLSFAASVDAGVEIIRVV